MKERTGYPCAYFRAFFRSPPPARKGEVNYGWIDRFTAAHFGIGVFYGAFELSFTVALILAIAWEFIEDRLKYHVSFLFPNATSDTFRNLMGDVIAVMLGWLCFHQL